MNRLFPVRRQPTQNPIGFQLREIDVFTPVTPAGDVIETTGQLDSQGTCHGAYRIVRKVAMQDLTLSSLSSLQPGCNS
jgi:hypothetical protein